MNDNEMRERLVRLETEGNARQDKLESMEIKLDSLIDRFTRYEAKWGGIVMIMSAVLGLLLAFKNEIKERFFG